MGYWSDFPDTYRTEHIEAIAKWIAVGESGVVVGGSGAGKSNLVGFLTTRHDVVGRYLPGDIDDYAFIHMDVNALPTINTPFFYRAMLLGVQNAARQIDPALLAEIKSASEMLISLEDTLGLHFVLQQAHDMLVTRAGKQHRAGTSTASMRRYYSSTPTRLTVCAACATRPRSRANSPTSSSRAIRLPGCATRVSTTNSTRSWCRTRAGSGPWPTATLA